MDPGVIDYARAHWSTNYTYSESEYERNAARYRYNFRHILPADKAAKILDVGCGGGFFLNFLRREGFHNLRGIEADVQGIAAARKMGFDVEQADAFEFLAQSENCFDCIVINQVLEHFPRDVSLSLLRLAQAALGSGGYLIGSVPNGLNPFAGFLMYGDLSHDHLYTPKSFEDTLIVAGFEDVTIHPEGPVPYDFKTSVRWGLWKIRESVLRFLFMIDIGIGRNNPLQCIFTQSIIASARKSRLKC